MKKYFLSFVSLTLAVLMLFSALITVTAQSKLLYLGDVNLNAAVNVKDATLIQKHAASIEQLEDDALVCADVNADDSVNIKDATAVQKYVAGENDPYDIGSVINKTPPATEPTTTEPTTASVPSTTVVPTDPQEDKMDTNITIYFSNNVGWKTVNAYLYNESKGIELKAWPGTAMTLHGTNSYGEQIYKMNVDVSQYNRVVFNNGQSQSMNAALSVASSGFFITTQTPKKSMGLGLYAFDETDYGKLDTVTLGFPECGKTKAYEKPIYIWTPKGYNPDDTSKKYPVIYLLDGQNQFDDEGPYNGGWGSDEVITSLIKNGGDGVILVGIDNNTSRDNELTPDLGPVPADQLTMGDFSVRTGEEFSKFVVDKVVPYINDNYNVSTDVNDTYVVGSSSGGLEAFYIGMENMNIFGGIGAISPAFLLFEKNTWDKYLAKFDFSNTNNLPEIYFYNGGGDSLEKMLLSDAKAMPQWLEALGYPADKMTFVYEESFAHNEAAWRCMMPEIVAWLMNLQ